MECGSMQISQANASGSTPIEMPFPGPEFDTENLFEAPGRWKITEAGVYRFESSGLIVSYGGGVNSITYQVELIKLVGMEVLATWQGRFFNLDYQLPWYLFALVESEPGDEIGIICTSLNATLSHDSQYVCNYPGNGLTYMRIHNEL
jgi:hypothetical protein